MIHTIKSKIAHEVGYGRTAGVALASPFIAAVAPAYIFALLLLPLAATCITQPPRQISLSINTLLLVLIILSYFTANLFHNNDFWYINIKNCIWISIIIFIIIFIKKCEFNLMLKFFYISMTILFTLIAIFGLLKFILQINGIIFGFLIYACGVFYPQGTNVCGDYNIIAMTLAVAAISATVLAFQAMDRPAISVALSACVVILVIAGLFVGSRRFAFVITTVPVLWILLTYYSARPWRGASLGAVVMICVGCAYVALDYPYDAVPNHEIRLVEDITQGRRTVCEEAFGKERNGPDFLSCDRSTYSLAPRRTSPTDLTGTISTDVGGRIDRWEFAWNGIKDDGYIIGRGLSYQEDFSCHFVDCEHLDYPHSTLMSAWLAFGIVGLIGGLLFYAIPGINALRNGLAGYANGTFPILLVVMPFSLISGDTVLSIWPATVAALLVDLAHRSLAAQGGGSWVYTFDLGRLFSVTSAAPSSRTE